MFNLASSLLYNSLFQQNNNGEFEHKGNSAIKPPTYTLGLKAIPDDVVWALSAINLDQYELPEWVCGSEIAKIFWSNDQYFFAREVLTSRVLVTFVRGTRRKFAFNHHKF